MATSTFILPLNVPGLGGNIYIVPSSSAVNGDMPLSEDPGRAGQYYREDVPNGEYKVYIDTDKSGSPVEGDLYALPNGDPYLIWQGEKLLSLIAQYHNADGSSKPVRTDYYGTNVIKNPFLFDSVETNGVFSENVSAVSIVNDTAHYSGRALKAIAANTSNAKLKYLYSQADLAALKFPILPGNYVKFGCYIRVNSGTPTGYIYNPLGSGVQIALSTIPQWIESPAWAYSGGNLQPEIITTGHSAGTEIYVSGITMKKVGANGEYWYSAEQNLYDMLASINVLWKNLPFSSMTLGTNLFENYQFKETDPTRWPFTLSMQSGTQVSSAIVDITQIPGTRISKAHKCTVTPDGATDVARPKYTYSIPKSVLMSRKNYLKNGDKFVYGFYAKIVGSAGYVNFTMYYKKGGAGQYPNSVIYNGNYTDGAWIWVEFPGLIYGDDDPLFMQPTIEVTGVTASIDVYITGLILKNEGNGNDYNGYEENSEYESSYAAKIAVGESIDKSVSCWGDSLTAGMYPSYLRDILGVTVYNGGVGSQKSFHIRDRILADSAHKNQFCVFWMGRNNLYDNDFIDTVLYDLRKAVEYIGHRRFIVLSVLNGNYPNEFAGQIVYNKLMELNTRLAQTYPNQFIDIRRFIIHKYDYKDTFLQASFTQPAIGSNVTIQVNKNDWASVNDSLAVGKLTGADYYTVISKPDSTHLTLRLDTANVVQPGNSVANDTSTIGGTTSTNYLRVMVKQDVLDYQNDITPSSLRADSIHLSDSGYNMVAQKIADFIRGGKY